ncbi:MAG: hypothetical protein ACXVB9_15555 [Bdellovibrionota bacterium]
MARLPLFSVLGLAAMLALGPAPRARAGDEDVKEAKKKAEEKTPEDTALPQDVEAPEMSVGDGAEPTPDYEEVKPETPSRPVRVYKEWDPDGNVDYSRLDDTVEPLDAGRGVLAPALGFRGYRPSMIAIGGGDRVPGFGGMVEYSWNRIGAGLSASYRSTKGEDPNVVGYNIVGLYGLYRWLPFDMSPYFLLGLEAGRATAEPVGGMLGLGAEARIYSGYTVLLGWTYHSTVERGFFGGAFGWSF